MLDRFDLDRYWRYAVPVAWAGCGASLTWAAALTVFDLQDAPVAVDIGLFLGSLLLLPGTALTEQRFRRVVVPIVTSPCGSRSGRRWSAG